jgi:hypothetical protein
VHNVAVVVSRTLDYATQGIVTLIGQRLGVQLGLHCEPDAANAQCDSISLFCDSGGMFSCLCTVLDMQISLIFVLCSAFVFSNHIPSFVFTSFSKQYHGCCGCIQLSFI